MMRPRHAILAAACASLCFSGSVHDAAAQSCQKDNDCAGDLVCNAGQCQTLSGETPAPGSVPVAPMLGALGTAEAPAEGAVTVNFMGDSVVLTHEATAQQCQVPCSMQLPPGAHKIKMNGMKWDIFVARSGGTFQVSQGDTGRIVGGAISTAFGIVGTVIGLVFTIVGDTSDDSSSTSSRSSDEDGSGTDLSSVGVPMLIGGGALLTTGIILLAGAEQPGVTASAVLDRGVPMVGVAPIRGGGMVGASFKF